MPSHRTRLHITSKTSRPSREIYREENLAVRSPLLARRHGLGGAAAAPRLAIFFILPPKKGPAERPPTRPANSEHGRNLKPAIVSSHQSSRKGAPRFRVMLPRAAETLRSDKSGSPPLSGLRPTTSSADRYGLPGTASI